MAGWPWGCRQKAFKNVIISADNTITQHSTEHMVVHDNAIVCKLLPWQDPFVLTYETYWTKLAGYKTEYFPVVFLDGKKIVLAH